MGLSTSSHQRTFARLEQDLIMRWTLAGVDQRDHAFGTLMEDGTLPPYVTPSTRRWNRGDGEWEVEFGFENLPQQKVGNWTLKWGKEPRPQITFAGGAPSPKEALEASRAELLVGKTIAFQVRESCRVTIEPSNNTGSNGWTRITVDQTDIHIPYAQVGMVMLRFAMEQVAG